MAPASDVDALVESITGPGIEVVSSALVVGSAATTGTFVGDGSDVDQEAALPFDSGVILGTVSSRGSSVQTRASTTVTGAAWTWTRRRGDLRRGRHP